MRKQFALSRINLKFLFGFLSVLIISSVAFAQSPLLPSSSSEDGEPVSATDNVLLLEEETQLEAEEPVIEVSDYSAHELIIKFEPNAVYTSADGTSFQVSSPELRALIDKYAINAIIPIVFENSLIHLDHVYLVVTSANADTLQIADEFSGLPEVTYAQPNYRYHDLAIPEEHLHEMGRIIVEKLKGDTYGAEHGIAYADLTGQAQGIFDLDILKFIFDGLEAEVDVINFNFGSQNRSSVVEEAIEYVNSHYKGVVFLGPDVDQGQGEVSAVEEPSPNDGQANYPTAFSSVFKVPVSHMINTKAGPEKVRPRYLAWIPQNQLNLGPTSTFEVHWDNWAPVTTRDWIGCYRVKNNVVETDNAKFLTYLQPQFVFNTGATKKGKATFKLPKHGLYQGEIACKYFEENTYKDVATTNFAKVRYSGKYQVTVTPKPPQCVRPGQNITIAIKVDNSVPTTQKDWVGTFIDGDADNNNSLRWVKPQFHYTNAARVAQFQTGIPKHGIYPREYVAKYLLNDGMNEVGQSEPFCMEYTGDYQLTVDKQVVKECESFNVSFNVKSSAPVNQRDWIGIFMEYERDNTKSFLWMQPQFHYTNGARTGKFKYTVPCKGAISGRVIAKYLLNDGMNEVGQSDPFVLDAGRAPLILNILPKDITGNYARITWNTDIPGTSMSLFGLDQFSMKPSAKNTTLVTKHSVRIGPFIPLATVYYRPESEDSRKHLGVGPIKTFRSSNQFDRTPPGIRNLRHSQVTRTTATITFDTTEAADREVVFWYWKSTTKITRRIFNSLLRLSHRFDLDNLVPNTDYWYHVIAHDAARNRAQSTPDQKFKTLP